MDNLTITSNSLSVHELNISLYERFISYVDAKPKTVATYKRSLKQFFKYLMDNGIKQPTRTDILNYRNELKKRLKASTVQAYIVAVRLFFAWTEQEGIYPNIANRIKGAKITKGYKKDPLSANQLKDILSQIDRETIKGKRDYAMILVMLTGGLRTIAIHRANIEDLRTLAGQTVLYIQGKGHDDKVEYIKIPPEIEKPLREYLIERNGASPSEPLFVSTSNNNQKQRLSTRSISQIAKDAFVKAGYDDERITAHSLRHTTATINLLSGGTLEETQQLLRHSNINTTMIYSHHIDKANSQSEARVASAIFS